jgi:hypothetical protein
LVAKVRGRTSPCGNSNVRANGKSRAAPAATFQRCLTWKSKAPSRTPSDQHTTRLVFYLHKHLSAAASISTRVAVQLQAGNHRNHSDASAIAQGHDNSDGDQLDDSQTLYDGGVGDAPRGPAGLGTGEQRYGPATGDQCQPGSQAGEQEFHRRRHMGPEHGARNHIGKGRTHQR